jgi:hypothetical protein
LRSAEGAKAICQGIVSHVVCQINSHSAPHENEARQWIFDAVERVRSELSQLSEATTLSDFHATLVGVIAGPKGGYFFHIGDGAACATHIADLSRSILSLPENGEYANETYFFTQPHWDQHLRLTPIDEDCDLIFLMSDGVTPFALAPRSTGPYAPFFEPLSRYLATRSREEGEEALSATLQKDALRRVTGDDKTLLWALRCAANA